MSNFLTHPCLETIEASLIIGNVLSYNMNPGVAYIFLGMTLRMAFSIGLQINSTIHGPTEQWVRRRVWWALAWQDSHFAVSYDRPTSSVLCIPDIPYGKFSSPGDRSYAESMFAIIRLTQEIIRERLLHPRSYMTWDTIRRYTDEIAAIYAEAAIHLRERSHCHQMTQHLERLALKLHSSYITSELCRPALKEASSSSADGQPSSATPVQSPSGSRRKVSQGSAQSPTSSSDAATRARFRRECIQNLEGTVAAYVELHSLSKFAARSWIGIQRSISAAFLLGTLPETNQEPRIITLLRNLEKVIAQRTMEDPTFEGTQAQEAIGSPAQQRQSQPTLAESPHWARSMAKSLNALGKLNAALIGGLASVKVPGGYNSTANLQTGPAGAGAAPNIFTNTRTNPNAPQGPQSQYSVVPNLKQEPYSPGMGNPVVLGSGVGLPVAAVGMGPITPDSTGSSGDWNYGNLHERAAEYVQAPLWGDSGLGGYVI